MTLIPHQRAFITAIQSGDHRKATSILARERARLIRSRRSKLARRIVKLWRKNRRRMIVEMTRCLEDPIWGWPEPAKNNNPAIRYWI